MPFNLPPEEIWEIGLECPLTSQDGMAMKFLAWRAWLGVPHGQNMNTRLHNVDAPVDILIGSFNLVLILVFKVAYALLDILHF